MGEDARQPRELTQLAEDHASGLGLAGATVRFLSNSATYLEFDGKLYTMGYTLSDGGATFGVPEVYEGVVYASSDEPAAVLCAARDVVEAILSGDASLDASIDALVGSVRPGARYDVLALAESMMASSSTLWREIYIERQREIRATLGAMLGEVRTAASSKRYGALVESGDIEAHRGHVLASLRALHESYACVHSVVESALETTQGACLAVADAAIKQNARAFAGSLAESAGKVTVDARQLLALEASLPTNRLVLVHDVLAEGVEDYAVCAEFVKRLLRVHANTMGVLR